MGSPVGRRRATMAQVARAAGVSVMTVSYTYGRPDRVAVATRAAVLDAADRLGYPGPHPAARSLRRGRTGNLGMVLGERLTYAFDDRQATHFLSGVAQVCAELGTGLTLLPVTGASTDVVRIRQAAVDGFVVWTIADDDPVVTAIAATGLPAVVHGGPRRDDLSLVSVEDRAAARAVAGETFVGARRPGVLSFPLDRTRASAIKDGPDPDAATFRVTRERLHGFRDAWTADGAAWADVRVGICATNSATEAAALAAKMLAGPTACDAIAAMSDELALGVLRTAARLNRAVPDDLAVSGWDDTEAAGPAGLTTVAQSLRDQGIACASIALDAAPPQSVLDACRWRLVARASTRQR